MKTKRTISIAIVCVLVVIIFGSALVFARHAPKGPKDKEITELIYEAIIEDVNPKLDDISGYSFNAYHLTGNTHDWDSITQALDDIKNEISTIEDAVDNVNLPQLDDIVDIVNKLDVEALCYQYQASAGNDEPILVHVTVTSFDGQSVTGLTAANFLIYQLSGATSDPPWRVTIDFVGVNSDTYYLYVEPDSSWGNTWGSGPQNFALEVTQGYRSGRTLTTVTVN